MFKTPSLEKYRFYVAKDRVIAVSSYAGRPVRGVAKCASDDEFNLEIGKKLAAARCNQKITLKRVKRANHEYHKALQARSEAQEKVEAMGSYQVDAYIALGTADKAVQEILELI